MTGMKWRSQSRYLPRVAGVGRMLTDAAQIYLAVQAGFRGPLCRRQPSL